MRRIAAAPEFGGIEPEKMLVGNAALVRDLTFALRAGESAELREALEATIAFISSSLARPGGGFHLAELPAEPGEAAPGVVETLLSGPNALAGAALVRAALLLGDEETEQRGSAALELVISRAIDPVPGVRHSIEPDSGDRIYLEALADTAFGLIDAYESTGRAPYLEAARRLVDRARVALADSQSQAFFDHVVEEGSVGLLANPRRPLRPNARLARAMVRLDLHGFGSEYRDAAIGALGYFAGNFSGFHSHATEAALAVEEIVSAPLQITIDGPPRQAAPRALRQAALRLSWPWTVIKVGDPTSLPTAHVQWGDETKRISDPERLELLVRSLTGEVLSPMSESRGAGIAVLGGSGLYALAELEDPVEVRPETPYGAPSDAVRIGKLAGRDVAFLARHGRDHRLLPSEINYRANLWALKSLGVERVLAVSAVGSMAESIRPREVVLVDQFVDRTQGRAGTFFGEGVVAHVSLADPVCPELRGVLRAAAGEEAHDGGTYLCIEGPAFSTRAESRIYRTQDVDVIGMTNIPEAKLAREAEICYATLALVTDYDCWHEEEEDVSVDALLANLHANSERASEIVRATVEALEPRGEACRCGQALTDSVLTPVEKIPAAARERLEPILRRFLASRGSLSARDCYTARSGPLRNRHDGSDSGAIAGRNSRRSRSQGRPRRLPLQRRDHAAAPRRRRGMSGRARLPGGLPHRRPRTRGPGSWRRRRSVWSSRADTMRS